MNDQLPSMIASHENTLAEIISQPVSVPFAQYAAQRLQVLQVAHDLPPYLLLPEIHALLDATLNDRHRLLFNFMWQTGARITEALAVRPKDLSLESPLNSYVSLATLKKGAGKSRKTVSNKTIKRAVPIVDERFILELQRYIKSHAVKQLSPLFDFSRQAANKALDRWAAQVTPSLPISVSPHTFRHSFAVNHLLHGQQLYDIKTWLGHSSIKYTEIYLQVLGSDTNHLAIRTRFR